MRSCLVFCLIVVISSSVAAEEVIRVQATPQVQPVSQAQAPQMVQPMPQTQSTQKIQAANLAPVETKSQPQVIELKPQIVAPVRVQATPTVDSIPQTPEPVQIQPKEEQKEIPAKSVGQTQFVPTKPSSVTGANLVTPMSINQELCSKMFGTSAETLFLYTLGAIEANNFEIVEMQSKGGFVIFKVLDREFLATVSVIDNKTAMLRINPTNGVYHFAPGIVTKIFEYVNFKLG